MNLLRLIPRKWLPPNAWGDREFFRRRYIRRYRRLPNPCRPEQISDHLYGLKMDGTLPDPLCQFVTDKEFAKLYMANAVGPDYLPETYRIMRTTSRHSFQTAFPAW